MGALSARRAAPMIIVHHLEASRSQRVLWLLEELDLPYQIVAYRRDPKTMFAPPALKAVHPLGKSPVLVDDGIVVAESGAIMEHVLDAHGGGRLKPAGGEALRRWRFWMHFAEGSAMPPLLMTLVFQRIVESPMPFFVRPIARGIADNVNKMFLRPNLTAQLDFMEAELARGGWFAGDAFSAADVQMSFPVEVAAQRLGLGEARPRLAQFLAAIQARPAYARARQRAAAAEAAAPR